jgi:hypothetical protein
MGPGVKLAESVIKEAGIVMPTNEKEINCDSVSWQAR